MGNQVGEVGWSRLLARLDPDAERAALEYERLRRTLVKFFEWRGASHADECADETLDRLARRLEETPIVDVRHYAHGIARLVLLERRRRPIAVSLDDDGPLAERLADRGQPDDHDDGLRDCFDRCLANVPAENRSLIMSYYEGERAGKISNRRELAMKLSLSDNALRSRVQRLRASLERCVRGCLAAQGHKS